MSGPSVRRDSSSTVRTTLSAVAHSCSSGGRQPDTNCASSSLPSCDILLTRFTDSCTDYNRVMIGDEIVERERGICKREIDGRNERGIERRRNGCGWKEKG